LGFGIKTNRAGLQESYMKVAVIIDTWFPFIGGGQINAWEISRRIAQKGTEVDIITRNNGQDNLKNIKNLKIVKLGPFTKPGGQFSRLSYLIRAFFYINSKNYNLIHAHAFLPGIVARLLMVFKGIPSVLTVHGTSINTKLNNFYIRWLEKFILFQILYSAQITVSRDFLRIPNVNKNIYYIPNGVDVGAFDKVKVRKFKDPTLIFVGRLHPQKNLPILLQCINTLKQRFPSVQLLIVGDGEEKHILQGLIKNLGLSKNVKLLGEIKRPQLIKIYKSSHLFILPSIYEGQPLTLLEAWAAKLPVIVSKTGDCQYLVKNGTNGYLINHPNDSQEIANLIFKAFKNRNLEKLGQNGYNLVKQFSWDKSAQETLQVYKNVI